MSASDTIYILFTYHHGPILAPIDDPQSDPARLGRGTMAVFTSKDGELHCKNKVLAYTPGPNPQQTLYFVPVKDIGPSSQTQVQLEREGGKHIIKIGGAVVVVWNGYLYADTSRSMESSAALFDVIPRQE